MKRNNKGFTLLELLIIVSIIGILVAISIPAFTSQIEKSRRAVDIANARTIKSALTLALSTGELQITDDTTEITLHINAEKVNGGCYKDTTKVFINGVKYNRYTQILNLISKYGASDQIRMQQKKIDWYAVSINGKGECYYYEGKGNMNDYKNPKVATKYSWSELEN